MGWGLNIYNFLINYLSLKLSRYFWNLEVYLNKKEIKNVV